MKPQMALRGRAANTSRGIRYHTDILPIPYPAAERHSSAPRLGPLRETLRRRRAAPTPSTLPLPRNNAREAIDPQQP